MSPDRLPIDSNKLRGTLQYGTTSVPFNRSIPRLVLHQRACPRPVGSTPESCFVKGWGGDKTDRQFDFFRLASAGGLKRGGEEEVAQLPQPAWRLRAEQRAAPARRTRA